MCPIGGIPRVALLDVVMTTRHVSDGSVPVRAWSRATRAAWPHGPERAQRSYQTVGAGDLYCLKNTFVPEGACAAYEIAIIPGPKTLVMR